MQNKKLAHTIKSLKSRFGKQVDFVEVDNISYHGTTNKHVPLLILIALCLYALLFLIRVPISKQLNASLVGADSIETGQVVCAWPGRNARLSSRSGPPPRVRVKPLSDGKVCGDHGEKLTYVGTAPLRSREAIRQADIEATQSARDVAFKAYYEEYGDCTEPGQSADDAAWLRYRMCIHKLSRKFDETPLGSKFLHRAYVSSRLGMLIAESHSFQISGSIYHYLANQLQRARAGAILILLPLAPLAILLVDGSMRRATRKQWEKAENSKGFGLYLREFKRELNPGSHYRSALSVLASEGASLDSLFPHSSSYENVIPTILPNLPWVAIANTQSPGFSGYSLRVAANDAVWFEAMKQMARESSVIVAVIYEMSDGLHQEVEWLLASRQADFAPVLFILTGKAQQRKKAAYAILALAENLKNGNAIKDRLAKGRKAPILICAYKNMIYAEAWHRRPSSPADISLHLRKKNSEISKNFEKVLRDVHRSSG